MSKNGRYAVTRLKSVMLVVSAAFVFSAALFFYCLKNMRGLPAAGPVRIAALVVSALLFSCVIFIFFEFFKPLKKLSAVMADMNDAKLMENNGTDNLMEALEDMGAIGIVITSFAKNISKEPQARMLGAEVALYALQSQINPHFLYNTLDTIRNYSLNYGMSEVADMTQSLAVIFRYSISRPGEVASLADEINNVKAYLKIQRYRFVDRFTIMWDIDEENDEIMRYSLPVLTLQPLVENAIQHGLENKLNSGMITIRATTTLSKLIVSIEDNGCGIPAEKLDTIRAKLEGSPFSTEESMKKSMKRKSGISLENVNNRLKLYFGSEGGLNINSMAGLGTMVEIEVPKI